MQPRPLPRRPLVVSHSAEAGGSNEVVLSLLRHRPAGSEPTCVFLADGPVLGVLDRLGIRVELVEAGPARHVWRAPGVIRRLRRTARETDADLVFAHVAKAHAYASPAARAARLPYLWWQHDVPRPTPSGRLAARLPAAAVVCSSDFTAERQRRLGSRHVVRVHPGVELGDDAAPSRSGVPAPPTIGAVGRLRRYKRLELLLAAVPAVLEEEPEVRFEIAGGATADTTYPDELHRLAAALGVEHAVVFRGHVPAAAATMREYDVVVHTAELEPFGLVVAEALLHGVPVVCPRDGGPAEIVRDGVDGIHVDVEDREALAQAILALVRDPAQRESMGRSGATHVRERFTAERMARDAWQLAADVAGGRARSA